MRGATVLAELERAGLLVSVQGADLIVRPASRLTPRARDIIRANKPALLSALTEAAAERLRQEYEERAAIGEFEGGLRRAEAERQAWDYVVVAWMNEPINAEPLIAGGTCPACQRALDHSEVLVLRPGGGHTPLHSGCTPRWLQMRRNEAMRGLIAAGISAPVGILLPDASR